VPIRPVLRLAVVQIRVASRLSCVFDNELEPQPPRASAAAIAITAAGRPE
jgi:hypothetical protein